MFLCSFSRFWLTSLFRSELLDVRMLSTGKIRWHLWAPLVLLALVSGVPSKAQDQGKCSPPPCFSLFCFRPLCYTSPQVICSQSPLIFTLHHPPLHFSPLLFSLSPISTSSRCLMCRLTPLITRAHSHHFTQVFCRFTHMSEGCNKCACDGGASNCDRAANAQRLP